MAVACSCCRVARQVLPGKRGIYFETEAGHLRGGAWRLRAALLTALKAWPWPGRGLREGRLPGAVQKTSPRPESAFGVLECDSTRRIGPELRRTVPSTGPAPSQPIAALAVAGIETSEAARVELKHAASSTDATAGDLYALRRPRPRMELRIWAKPQLRPSNASCLVANPRGSRGSRGEGRGGAGLKSRQFLTQTENISPSFTLSAALFNPGKGASKLRSKTASRATLCHRRLSRLPGQRRPSVEPPRHRELNSGVTCSRGSRSCVL